MIHIDIKIHIFFPCLYIITYCKDKKKKRKKEYFISYIRKQLESVRHDGNIFNYNFFTLQLVSNLVRYTK